tara:strand:+ start:546 stop:722 length:177 start_codon:yes stop_codon:yes gene_type:complete
MYYGIKCKGEDLYIPKNLKNPRLLKKSIELDLGLIQGKVQKILKCRCGGIGRHARLRI